MKQLSSQVYNSASYLQRDSAGAVAVIGGWEGNRRSGPAWRWQCVTQPPKEGKSTPADP